MFIIKIEHLFLTKPIKQVLSISQMYVNLLLKILYEYISINLFELAGNDKHFTLKNIQFSFFSKINVYI